MPGDDDRRAFERKAAQDAARDLRELAAKHHNRLKELGLDNQIADVIKRLEEYGERGDDEAG